LRLLSTMDYSKFKAIVKPYLLECRHGDYEHTLRVVKWMKVLMKTEGGDPEILIPAAYLHEIGYYTLLPKEEKDSLKRDEMIKKYKQEHMKRGAKLAEKILKDMNYPKDKAKRIVHLVSVHDNWFDITDKDEFILSDSDNLSKLLAKHIKTKYAKSDWTNVVDIFKTKLPKRLHTPTAKKLFKIQISKLKEEFGSNT